MHHRRRPADSALAAPYPSVTNLSPLLLAPLPPLPGGAPRPSAPAPASSFFPPFLGPPTPSFRPSLPFRLPPLPPFSPRHPQERSKALRPNPGPVSGAGRQGRIGTTGGTLLTQHLLRQKGGLVGVEEEMDPREAILRHAGKEDEISRLTAAYQKTQPQPIFAEPSDEEEEGEEGGEGQR